MRDAVSTWQVNRSDYDMFSHFGGFTMVAISGMFGAAQPLLLRFPLDRGIFLREYATGSYSAAAYFLSKMMVEMPQVMAEIYPRCTRDDNGHAVRAATTSLVGSRVVVTLRAATLPVVASAACHVTCRPRAAALRQCPHRLPGLLLADGVPRTVHRLRRGVLGLRSRRIVPRPLCRICRRESRGGQPDGAGALRAAVALRRILHSHEPGACFKSAGRVLASTR